MKLIPLQRVAPLVLALLLAVTQVACGDDDDERGGSEGSPTEAAFLEAMVPHHESAITMAKMARERGEHPEIKQLAGAIIRAQTREISQIGRIHRRLFGEPIKPNPDAHMALGLSAEEAGMAHTDMSGLEREKPFDRAFIDEMVAHHQGAIRMARAVSEETSDDEIKQLADGIIQAQAAEIESMNSWRKRWYGAVSPAGGVPSRSESNGLPPEDDAAGEHEGH